MAKSYSWDVTANIVTKYDDASSRNELDRMNRNIQDSIKPIKIKSQFSKVDVGDSQSILDNIRNQANAIDSVIVKQRTLKNVAGETLTGLTQMTVKYVDANGNLLTEVKKINSEVSTMKKGFTVDSEITGQLNLGKSVKKVSALYKKRLESHKEIATKSADWAIRSEKMGKEDQKAIQGTNEKLQEKIALYEKWVGSGRKTGLIKLKKEIDSLTATQEKNISATKMGAGAVRNWSENMANAIKQTIAYTFSIGGLRAAQELLNDVMEYTVELNTEMTKIQVLQAEGAQTDAQIDSLASSYNKLAKELSATTLEVAQGSVEWLRQGKSIEETQTLMVSTMALSKLGALTSAEATEYLTSTLNSYNMEADEAVGVVDKLIAVDNIAATSTKELATALRYSAASAKDAGVSLEELISYIAVVSSTTRQNAESIGQGMKTMLTRMQDIKEGAIDDDGLGINNVERALKRVEIPLRDTSDSFRDMSDVLEDVASKWSGLNDIEQANIAKSIAGVRQVNMFRVLMTNMNDAIALQEEQFGAAGMSAERYEIYINSVEGSQNKARASLEGLFMTLRDFDEVIVGANKFASALLDMATNAGGLRTLIIALATGLAIYAVNQEWAFIATMKANIAIGVAGVKALGAYIVALTTTGTASVATAVATGNLTLAFQALNLSNPVGWVILLTGALVALAYAMPTPIERAKELNEEIAESIKATEELGTKASALKKLSAEYKELGDNQNRSRLEEERWLEVNNQIKEMFPELLGTYDEYGNFIISASESMKELTKDTLANVEANKLETKTLAEANIKQNTKGLSRAYNTAQNYQGLADAGQMTQEQADEAMQEYLDLLDSEKQNFMIMGREHQLAYIESLTKRNPQMGEMIQEFFDDIMLDASQSASAGRYEALNEYDLEQGGERDVTVKYSDIESEIAKISELESSYSSVKEAVSEFGAKSVEAYEAMADALPEGSDLTDFLTESGAVNVDALKDNTDAYLDALREYVIESKEIVGEEEAGILAGIDAVQNAMQEEMYTAIDGMAMTASQFTNWAGDISGTIFTLADNAGFMLHDLAGNELASAENIKIALVEKAITFDQLMKQLTDSGIAYGQNVMSFFSQAGLFATQKSPYQAVAPDLSSSGSGGSGDSAEKTRLEGEIAAYNDKKDALKDQLSEYKKYIEAQKELLRLKKEEKEFEDEIMKKNLSLAKLKTNIALLALDDSEEAQAARLELEEEAADLEEEIAEDKEDRKYELQMDALDKAQDDFEDSINAQIDGIEDVISKFEEEKSAISSTSGAVSSLSDTIVAMWGNMASMYGQQFDLSQKNISLLDTQIQRWQDMGYDIDTARQLAWDYANALANVEALGQSIGRNPYIGVNPDDERVTGPGYSGTYHDGGIVGDIKGASTSPLKSTEVFARLMKNEGVFTEGQMGKFITETLPSMMSYPKVSPISQTGDTGNTTIEVNIPIYGNADMATVKNIEKVALNAMNKALAARGVRRNASSLAI